MANGFVEQFRLEAEQYLHEGRVGSIEFSHSTYQIEVKDRETGKAVFVFIQFDDEEMLSDAFCSCDREMCPHMAASFLRIYNGFSSPLHRRFKESFWNRLWQLLGDHFDYKAALKQRKGGVIVEFKPLTKELGRYFKEMLSREKAATPENSIKFSNVSQEEIQHWKEGRASSELRFELSFWADCAKWLMLRQDEGVKYAIQMEGEPLPGKMKIHFPGLEIAVQLTDELLAEVIGSLDTVESPLAVHRRSQEGITITYDPLAKRLDVHRKQVVLQERRGVEAGEWLYVSGEGFYPKSYAFELPQERFEEDEIEEALNEYGETIAKYLTNAKVNKTSVPLSYKMHFDQEWNLHVDAFLFTPFDLAKEGNAFFGTWGYIAEKGFYPLTGVLFETAGLVIPAQEMPNFIARYRHLLSHIKGFAFHLANIETTLSYSVNEKKQLCFLAKFSEDAYRVKEFGEWIYIEGEGFFAKKTAFSLAPGVVVEAHEVSSFIKQNRDELAAISGFFLPEQPLEKRGVALHLDEKNRVVITPQHLLHEPYKDSEVVFFDEHLYLVGHGFAELPLPFRLKERYLTKVTIEEKELSHFFQQEFPRLDGVITKIDPRIKPPHQLEVHLEGLDRSGDGFAAHFTYRTEMGSVDAKEIISALHDKQRYFFSQAGRIDLLDERFQWLGRAKQGEGKELQLSSIDFLRLDLDQGVYLEGDDSRKVMEELRGLTTSKLLNINGLKSDLRLYQKTGVEWLWFLYCNQLSGLLCDDMGLGKTHQAMALLAAAYNHVKEEGGRYCRFLVVAPTSVIYHWQEKLGKFLPHFKVHFYHGLKRSLKRLPKEGVVITSYGILRAEQEELRKIDFEVAIFDELQVAKNPSSRTHSALLPLKAKMRIGLSGTPIENNLRELKSLFDIVLPGYMPKEKQYRDHYILPIEREGSVEKRAQLARLIKPFVLRRKKKEVLQELPEKTEDKIYCDLTEEQQKLYQETLQRHQDSLLTPLQQGVGHIPYVHIFSILSSLKQICDHPALVKKDPARYKHHSSGKWNVFKELISEALESEQKVVVFTQYLHMLDIMEHYFQEIKVSYAQIRGDTSDRAEQLQKFQEDPNCLIFIGTLQAAGLGIDLTAASIVILYDRWWNAARENQAIDRVHRIGQKWGVQVYKLITKGTIEEKIDLLIAQKGRLLEEIVLSDDEGEIKRFTREELLDLLSYHPTT